MAIQETLSKIQVNLKAPKGQYNEYGKYKYRSLEDVMEALKPLLAEYEACVTCEDQIVNIGDRFYVEATVTLFCGGESINCKAYAREALTRKGQDESQITGSASSYARKYAMNGLFAIDDTKDADATNKHSNQDAISKWIDECDKEATVEDIKFWWSKNKDQMKKDIGVVGASDVYKHVLENIAILEKKDGTAKS